MISREKFTAVSNLFEGYRDSLNTGLFKEYVWECKDLPKENMDGEVDGEEGKIFTLLRKGTQALSVSCWNNVTEKDELVIVFSSKSGVGEAMLERVHTDLQNLFGFEPNVQRQ